MNIYMILMIICAFIAVVNVLFLIFDVGKWIINIANKINPTKTDAGYKFSWCGNALGIYNNKIFYAYKFFFSLLCLILIILAPIALWIKVCCLILVPFCFNIPDVILFFTRKNRENAIMNEIPIAINALSTFNQTDIDFTDFLTSVAQNLKGPLAKEIIRFTAYYLLEPDFELLITDFKKRLNVPGAEALELKIREKYYSGVYNNVAINYGLIAKDKYIKTDRRRNKLFSLAFILSMMSAFAILFLLYILPVII